MHDFYFICLKKKEISKQTMGQKLTYNINSIKQNKCKRMSRIFWDLFSNNFLVCYFIVIYAYTLMIEGDVLHQYKIILVKWF